MLQSHKIYDNLFQSHHMEKPQVKTSETPDQELMSQGHMQRPSSISSRERHDKAVFHDKSVTIRCDEENRTRIPQPPSDKAHASLWKKFSDTLESIIAILAGPLRDLGSDGSSAVIITAFVYHVRMHLPGFWLDGSRNSLVCGLGIANRFLETDAKADALEDTLIELHSGAGAISFHDGCVQMLKALDWRAFICYETIRGAILEVGGSMSIEQFKSLSPVLQTFIAPQPERWICSPKSDWTLDRNRKIFAPRKSMKVPTPFKRPAASDSLCGNITHNSSSSRSVAKVNRSSGAVYLKRRKIENQRVFPAPFVSEVAKYPGPDHATALAQVLRPRRPAVVRTTTFYSRRVLIPPPREVPQTILEMVSD